MGLRQVPKGLRIRIGHGSTSQCRTRLSERLAALDQRTRADLRAGNGVGFVRQQFSYASFLFLDERIIFISSSSEASKVHHRSSCRLTALD